MEQARAQVSSLALGKLARKRGYRTCGIELLRRTSSNLQKIFLNALVNQLPALFVPFAVFLPTSSPLSAASAPTAFVFSAATFVPLTVVSFTSPALSPTAAPTS